MPDDAAVVLTFHSEVKTQSLAFEVRDTPLPRTYRDTATEVAVESVPHGQVPTATPAKHEQLPVQIEEEPN